MFTDIQVENILNSHSSQIANHLWMLERALRKIEQLEHKLDHVANHLGLRVPPLVESKYGPEKPE